MTDGDPPRKLDAYGRATWKRLVNSFDESGNVIRIDYDSLARYCDLTSRYRKASDFLREHGSTFERRTPHGVQRAKYPQVAIVKDLAALLIRIEQEFGMTTASRSRLSARAASDVPDKQSFFSPQD